ncbi:MAG: 30S ribosomal protein S4, partial [Proteobacteria bacterium]|nr:30S ribosomal protein S4 [Pseudomonadota bacterium]
LCRRESTKLFLKGERCYTDKCAAERRQYAPGQHGQRRAKRTDYGDQLREKQKLKRTYGVLEKQFKNYFERAAQQKGITGENLLVFLERRLDNIVYRLGFAASRAEARQLVRNGHLMVNRKKVTIASYLVKSGDTVQLREKSQKIEKIKEAMEVASRRGISRWLELDKDSFSGTVVSLPNREDITMPIREQIIVELYSR